MTSEERQDGIGPGVKLFPLSKVMSKRGDVIEWVPGIFAKAQQTKGGQFTERVRNLSSKRIAKELTISRYQVRERDFRGEPEAPLSSLNSQFH